MGLGTEEGRREVGVAQSATPAIPDSRKEGWQNRAELEM